MTKNLRFILSISLVSIVFAANSLNAQKNVTANVPADAESVADAIDLVKDELEPGDSLIITVNPGTYVFDGRDDLGWDTLYVHVLIKGAGANQTTFKQDLLERPGPDNPGIKSFHSVFSETSDSSSLKIEGIKFMYGGNFTSKGDAIGAVLRLFRPESLEITFENCVFDNNTGITLFNAWRYDISYSFNNCQFTNNLTLGLGNAGRKGVIQHGGIKYLSVTNCTFMSNEVIDYAAFRETSSSALNISVTDSATTFDIVLENNAFINAKVNMAEFDTVLSVVKIEAGEHSDVNLTMNNNIFIGNFPDATGTPSDMLFINTESIDFTSGGNILNKALELTDEGEYVDFAIPGAYIDETYTYTDPRIDFTMAFDLPELISDEHGVGHVQYAGDGTAVGVEMDPVNELSAYVYDGLLKVKGLNAGDEVVVYNILGAIVKRKQATSDVLEMTLPKGLFIVKSGQRAKKVYSY